MKLELFILFSAIAVTLVILFWSKIKAIFTTAETDAVNYFDEVETDADDAISDIKKKI